MRSISLTVVQIFGATTNIVGLLLYNCTLQMYFAKRRKIRGVLNLISEKELDNPIAFSIGTHRSVGHLQIWRQIAKL